MSRFTNSMQGYAAAKGRSFGGGGKASSRTSSQMTIDASEFEEFASFLNRFAVSLDRRELHRILRRVLKSVVKAAQQEVNKIEMSSKDSTGNLWESIGLITGKSKTFVNIQVAPRAKGKYKGFHAHMVEFGTDRRSTKKGANRGAAKPHPFMKPAYNKTYGTVKPLFEREVAKYIQKRADQLI